MGCRLRLYEPFIVKSNVIRCVDRQFLLSPNHDFNGDPLLEKGCPPESLDPNNDLIPKPSIINIIGSTAARAQEITRAKVHLA